MLGIPLLLAWLSPYLSPFKWFATIWSYLPIPIRILIVLILTAVVSSVVTNCRAERRFAEIIRVSNENAVKLDKKINGDAAAEMKVKLDKIQEESRVAQNALSQYAIEYQQMKDNCNVDQSLIDKDSSINDGSIGSRLSNPAIPTVRKETPRKNKHNPRPDAMPPNKSR